MQDDTKAITYIEKNCVFTHEGKDFESGGAFVSPSHIIAYPYKNGILRDWHGEDLGAWKSVASWPVRSWYGSHMHQIEATVNGIVYTGRGFGEGMIYKGKRKAIAKVTP